MMAARATILVNPMRFGAPRIRQKIFLWTQIIRPIRRNGVALFILFWHRLWRLPPPYKRNRRGPVRRQPIQMLLTAVTLLRAKTIPVFLTQIRAKHAQPHVMLQALAHPNRTRVVLVLYRTITPLGNVLPKGRSPEIRRPLQEPMRGIQQLRRLQNHLHHMLVTVPARTTRWLVREIKDVHSSRGYFTKHPRPPSIFNIHF